jgi:regulatory protein
MLDRRAYARAELASALRRKGVPDDAAIAVLDRFCEVGLIDDVALARERLAVTRESRGLSRRAAALDLRRRGLNEQTVRNAIAEIDPADERATAERLVARKLPALRGLEPQVQARRLLGLLARRGYPPGLARDVVRHAVTGLATSDPVDPD